jgi:hypothetical protein
MITFVPRNTTGRFVSGYSRPSTSSGLATCSTSSLYDSRSSEGDSCMAQFDRTLALAFFFGSDSVVLAVTPLPKQDSRN